MLRTIPAVVVRYCCCATCLREVQEVPTGARDEDALLLRQIGGNLAPHSSASNPLAAGCLVELAGTSSTVLVDSSTGARSHILRCAIRHAMAGPLDALGFAGEIPTAAVMVAMLCQRYTGHASARVQVKVQTAHRDTATTS